MKAIKGVLLRDVLESVKLDTDNRKLFSEYYFVCKATDGYKVEGKPITSTEDNILMISKTDLHTGRRYLKNLETIYVGRAD